MGENSKWRNRIIETVQMRVGDLAVNKYNPKRHPASQEMRLEAVLEKFGIVDSLIAWRSERNDGQWTMFDGHLRQKLDPDQVWAVHKTSLIDAEIDELVAYFDPLAGMSLHDEAKLATLMQDLGDVDGVLGEMLTELAEGVGIAFGGDGDGPEDPGPQLDRAAELQEVWRVKRGDVWEIPSRSAPGKAHRLMCGDSTGAGDVERLMGGKKAALLLIDPPYGTLKIFDNEGRVGKANVAPTTVYGRYEGEGEFDLAPALEAAKGYYNKAVIWGGNYFPILPTTTSWLCWDKRAGEHSWYSDFELAWTSLGCPARLFRHTWQGMIRAGSDRERFHPTQKPVELMLWVLQDLAPSCPSVLDLFIGSGVVLVACEQTARIGFGMEISEKYCSVSLQRLKDMGLEPRLVEG